MVKLFANSDDPDQTPRFAASDLGLHCLPITLLGVSRLQWDKNKGKNDPKGSKFFFFFRVDFFRKETNYILPELSPL